MAWKKKDDDDDDDESTQEAKGENENVSRNSQGTCSETSLKDVTAPRTTSVCISFDRNVFVTQLELTFSPLSLQDPPFYRCTRGHTTHIHTINTENTFSFFFPETRHSLPVLLFSPSLHVTFPLFFSFLRKLFSIARETEQRATITRLVDESCRSLLFSLTLSLRAPTITLSHRRPEQKGKSMKEKYDASARKSAFMLASWSTVLWFHFDEHICVSVRVNVRAASRKLFTSDIVEKRDHQISSIVKKKTREYIQCV